MIGMNQLDTEDTALNLTPKLCVDSVKDFMMVDTRFDWIEIKICMYIQLRD